MTPFLQAATIALAATSSGPSGEAAAFEKMSVLCAMLVANPHGSRESDLRLFQDQVAGREGWVRDASGRWSARREAESSAGTLFHVYEPRAAYPDGVRVGPRCTVAVRREVLPAPDVAPVLEKIARPLRTPFTSAGPDRWASPVLRVAFRPAPQEAPDATAYLVFEAP